MQENEENGNVSDAPPMAFGQYLQSKDVNTFTSNTNLNINDDYESG